MRGGEVQGEFEVSAFGLGDRANAEEPSQILFSGLPGGGKGEWRLTIVTA
jgi:hypothetical protein